MINVKEITREVEELLGDSGDGHGIDHVLRVRDMAVSFAHQEGADERIVELASLLHDVDDYKIFGEDSALNLTNATFILRRHNVPVEIQSAVLDIVQVMGYNKYLESMPMPWPPSSRALAARRPCRPPATSCTPAST